MVRLEKILWERTVNTNMFNRTRQIGLPRKFFRYSAFDQNLWLAKIRESSVVHSVFGPIKKAWGEFVLKFHFDKYIKMGLSWEDKIVHTETDIRRDLFFEHIQRQNFHPYQWLLKSMRRHRYYKVERTMPGFQVPDYIINEASQSTFADAVRLQKQYTDFVFQNYESDQTHVASGTNVPKLIPLQFIIYNGLLRHESYDRYFYNEKYNLTHTQQINDSVNAELTTEERQQLRDELRKISSKVPSMINDDHFENHHGTEKLSH